MTWQHRLVMVSEGSLSITITIYQYKLVNLISAIMVTGGYYGSDLASVEVFSGAGTPISCTIPPLPAARYGHTQDGLLSCGGWGTDTRRNCVKISALAGGWVVSHNLLQDRSGHSSWQSPAGLVLIGGGHTASSLTTTELLSSSDSSSSSNFTLQYDTM